MGLLVEKYRPDSLEHIVLPYYVKEKIKQMIDNKDIPNLLLYGPPGTGKTTIARVIIKNILNNEKNALILNASDDRGIDVIRNKITPFISVKPANDNFRIVFMEEVGAPQGGLTMAAQSALLNIIEDKHTYARFIMTTNFPERLLPSLRSRFVQIKIEEMQKNDMLDRLRYICEQEQIQYDDQQLMRIISTAYPNMRNALQLLEGCIVQRANVKLIDDNLLTKAIAEIYSVNRIELSKQFIVALWKNRKNFTKETIKTLPFVIDRIEDIPIETVMQLLDKKDELELIEMMIDLRKKNKDASLIDLIAQILNSE